MSMVYLPDLNKTYLFLTVSLNSAELNTFMGTSVSVLHVCLWILRKSFTKVCEASEIKVHKSVLSLGICSIYVGKKTSLFIKLSSFKPIFLSIIF